jgi:sigma-B regulation protein RsbU (phosphoserine phosphatase)
MLRLILTDAQGPRVVPVDTTPFKIGRSSENTLQLSDPQVSRHHAELVERDSIWSLRDCGSRLGTFVNNRRTDETLLHPGDCVRIGQTELRVEAEGSGSSSAFDFRQVNALLAGLRALGSSHVLDEVLALVLDATLDLTGAERGFILLQEDTGRLEQRLARVRGGVTLGSAQISERIPQDVMATGEDRIVTDLLDEAHATQHAGTVALGIRHVLCTPLRVVQYASGVERRIGCLYLDSRERGYLQSVGALHALAAEAAVVIDNARLYQQVVEQERLAQELKVAAEIQRGLLPPGEYATAYADFFAYTIPCRAVGGDLFDYFDRPDGLTFVVADVAGKGPSAALLSAVMQGLLSAEALTAHGPGAVVSLVNRALCRRAVGARFVTAFYGHLTAGGALTYCNAGHNAPFHVRSDGFSRLDIGGTPLGIFDSAAFETGTTTLSPGDLVVAFSDGVTEALDDRGQEFGDGRLEACLAGAWSRPAREVAEQVRLSLGRFCGAVAARDDVTLAVLARR